MGFGGVGSKVEDEALDGGVKSDSVVSHNKTAFLLMKRKNQNYQAMNLACFWYSSWALFEVPWVLAVLLVVSAVFR